MPPNSPQSGNKPLTQWKVVGDVVVSQEPAPQMTKEQVQSEIDHLEKQLGMVTQRRAFVENRLTSLTAQLNQMKALLAQLP